MRMKIMLVFVLALLSMPAPSIAQLRNGQKFSDWAPIVHLPAPINSAFDDHAAILSKDENTLYFTSNRTGSVNGSEDIWVATRKNKNSRWRRPVNLGSAINTPAKAYRADLILEIDGVERK